MNIMIQKGFGIEFYVGLFTLKIHFIRGFKKLNFSK